MTMVHNFLLMIGGGSSEGISTSNNSCMVLDVSVTCNLSSIFYGLFVMFSLFYCWPHYLDYLIDNEFKITSAHGGTENHEVHILIPAMLY